MSNINKIRINNVDYDITDGETYDGIEKIIGTWFGQPLYQKEFRLTKAQLIALSKDSNNRYLLPHSISGIGIATYRTIIGSTTDNNVDMSVADIYNSGNWNLCLYNINPTNIEIFAGVDILNVLNGVSIIIKYIKTTDVVNS